MVTETPTAEFPYEKSLIAGVQAVVAKTLSKGDASADIYGLVASTIDFVETTNADLAQKQPPPKPLACAEGCHYCCMGVEVHASPLEVLALAEHLARTRPLEDLRAVLEKILSVQEAKEDAAAGEKTINFTCPLLADQRCSVYEVRPFSCRGFTSYDAARCAARKLGMDTSQLIEGYVHPRKVAACVHEGIQRGLMDAGLDGQPLDLTPGLLIALTTPDCREKWLAGEPVFAPARARHFNEPG